RQGRSGVPRRRERSPTPAGGVAVTRTGRAGRRALSSAASVSAISTSPTQTPWIQTAPSAPGDGSGKRPGKAPAGEGGRAGGGGAWAGMAALKSSPDKNLCCLATPRRIILPRGREALSLIDEEDPANVREAEAMRLVSASPRSSEPGTPEAAGEGVSSRAKGPE